MSITLQYTKNFMGHPSPSIEQYEFGEHLEEKHLSFKIRFRIHMLLDLHK